MKHLIFVFLLFIFTFSSFSQSIYSDKAAQYAEEGNYEYFQILSEIADYYTAVYDYEHAILVRLKLLKLMEGVWDKEAVDSLFTLNLNKLAMDYVEAGNYKEAIKIGHELVDIVKANIQYETSSYAIALGNLADYYSYVGDYEESIRLVKEALNSCDNEDGESIVNYLSNLAGYYDALQDYEKALQFEKVVVKLLSDNVDESEEIFIKSLLLLGRYYLHANKIKEGLSIIEEAKRLWLMYYDTDNPIYAHILTTVVSANVKNGNFEEAIKNSLNVLNIYQKYFGEYHPYVIQSYFDLFTIYLLSNKYNEIEDIIKTVVPLIKKNITQNFSYLPLHGRSMFWKEYSLWFESVIPIINQRFSQLSLTQQCYDGLLLSKGILLNSEREFDKFLAKTGDETLLEKYNEIKSLRIQLNKLYEKPIAERYVDTDSLERKANELERQLMQESAEFGDYTRDLSISWEDVRDNLKEKDAAIEFVSFQLNNDSTMYMAYVLRPNMKSPELVKLFEEKDLTSLYPKNQPENVYQKKKASSIIWGALAPKLDGVENIYFAPDGVLHQIAIEYFTDFENEGLIADRYNLYRLSSTRQIAMKQPAKLSDRAVIYGGIKYDTSPDMMKIESAKYFPTKRGYTSWYNTADSISVRSRQGYLEHTLTEAQSLKTLFNDNNQHPTLFIGNEASEESFKSLSGQHNYIIHIATHGFYWDESYAEYESSKNERLLFMSQFGDNARRNVEDKALTRTGLYMAGANNALNGDLIPEGVDDGILTAQEIANLDLRGLDLVVLSACQTGMGDIQGDGVFGLQRGFKKAGANTILMSLWSVDDAATQMLMTNFYKNLLTGMSKQLALANAQKVVRDFEGEIKGEYRNFSEPKYWAAFILLDAFN